MSPAEQLHAYLVSAYEPEDLRRWVALRYAEVASEVHWDDAETDVVYDLVRATEEHGLVGDVGFWAALVSDRPYREDEVRRIERAYGAPEPSQPRVVLDAPPAARPVWPWLVGGGLVLLTLVGGAVGVVLLTQLGTRLDTEFQPGPEHDAPPPAPPSERATPCTPDGCTGRPRRWRIVPGKVAGDVHDPLPQRVKLALCVDEGAGSVLLSHTAPGCTGEGRLQGWCRPQPVRPGQTVLSKPSKQHQVWRPGLWETDGARARNTEDYVGGSFCIVRP